MRLSSSCARWPATLQAGLQYPRCPFSTFLRARPVNTANFWQTGLLQVISSVSFWRVIVMYRKSPPQPSTAHEMSRPPYVAYTTGWGLQTPQVLTQNQLRLLKKLAPWRYWAGGEAVTRPGWLPVVFDSPASWRCRSSGRPQRSRRLAAGDELDKPFEILSGRRQVELLRHIPETPQPDAPHPEPLLEFGK